MFYSLKSFLIIIVTLEFLKFEVSVILRTLKLLKLISTLCSPANCSYVDVKEALLFSLIFTKYLCI